MMFIGYTFNGRASLRDQPSEATTRDVFIDLHVQVHNVLPASASKTLKIGAMPGDKKCNHVSLWNGVDHHNNILKKFGEWATGDTHRFRLRCPAANADNKRTVTWNESDDHRAIIDNTEAVTLGKLRLYGDFSDLPTQTGARVVANLGDGELEKWVQCDTANYLSRRTNEDGDTEGTGGCTFGDVVSSLQHELGNNYDTAYNHYWMACYQPNDTYPAILKPVAAKFPAIKEKSIPGCLDPTKNMRHNYLHRIDNDTADSNRRSMTRPKCEWLWPGGTGGTSGNECDEFPYAASWERWNPKYPGAIVTNAGYSLCPIPEEQNGAAGRVVGRLFTKDRILIGDPFFVRLAAAPPNPKKCTAPIDGRNV
jgi:hypothetical protein